MPQFEEPQCGLKRFDYWYEEEVGGIRRTPMGIETLPNFVAFVDFVPIRRTPMGIET